MKTGSNKCPHCERPISQLEVDDIHLTVDGRATWMGMSYGCPHCRKIVSVQMNPLTLAEDTAKEVAKKFGK